MIVRAAFQWLGRAALSLLLAALVGWSVLAMAFVPVEAGWIGGLLASLVGAAALGAVAFVRPWRRAAVALLGLFGIVLAAWLAIPPRNDRDWYPDVATVANATVDGTRVTLHNVRDCDYRSETDYTVRHHDLTVDLERLRTVDLFLCYWGPRAIAHTILSFGFESLDPTRTMDHVAISIETRKRKGQEYSALRGFFKQYEIIYIVADERDLIRLRTNFRKEDVYLYRLRADEELRRNVFLSYVREIQRLHREPEWYNALTHNCTTSIRGHTRPYAQKRRFDLRILLNGYIDELAREVGTIDASLPYEEMRARSAISARARACGEAPGSQEFSACIRAGLLVPGSP